MMFSYRLVRLIETHADTLAARLEVKVQTSSQVIHFREIPVHELKERVYEIYRHLGDWLLGKDELDIERRYVEIGAAPRPPTRAPQRSHPGHRLNKGKSLGVPEK